MTAYLEIELRTHKLSRLHKYLWLAGLPIPGRPLHRQYVMNRTIVLTERPDEHLVWHENRIFIKPLPEFLLCHEFWETYLCANPALHASACSMLLSYAWLVAHPSDLALALENKLLSPTVDWNRWTALIREVLETLDLETMVDVDPRYQYGELRLSRLNMVTRWMVPELWSRRNFRYGHMSSSTWYTAFFQRHFGWLLVGFVYISVMLSALQVGLGTNLLGASDEFQNIGFGITLASLVALFLASGSILIIWFGLFCYHMISTFVFDRTVQLERQRRMREATN
ncbi:hypothetical protein F5B20DRAFT_226861 [Whalleya microplaca]|nr:hypothetical protein F5B20DRAFT_226861 [Whalleya microplaca]